MSTTVTTRVMAVSRLTVTPPRVKPSPVKWLGKGLGLEPEDEQEAILEHEADADGGNERRHSRTAPERLIGQTLDGHAQHRS